MLVESFLLDYIDPRRPYSNARLVRVEGDLKGWCNKNKVPHRKLKHTTTESARHHGTRAEGYRILTHSNKYGEVVNDYTHDPYEYESVRRKPYCPGTESQICKKTD